MAQHKIPKTASVQIRLEPTQLDALEQAAAAEGESVSNWCRRNLLKVAGWTPARPAQHN